MKYRIIHLLQKYFLNPQIKILFAIGLVPPGYALHSGVYPGPDEPVLRMVGEPGNLRALASSSVLTEMPLTATMLSLSRCLRRA